MLEWEENYWKINTRKSNGSDRSVPIHVRIKRPEDENTVILSTRENRSYQYLRINPSGCHDHRGTGRNRSCFKGRLPLGGACRKEMEAQRIFPECVNCLISLAGDFVSLARGDHDDLRSRAESLARSIIEANRDKGWSSPVLAQRILEELKQFSVVADPYEGFKNMEMARAREILSRLELGGIKDLRARITLSALGNSLDFFQDPKTALEQVPNLFKKGLSFYYDDIERLEFLLAKGPDLILYLADNSGEIYFDLPLYESLARYAGRTVLVVKGGPSLNDLTRKELSQDGLEGRFQEIVDTGIEGVGIHWDRIPKSLLDLMDQADLIFSKGMANFETIYPRERRAPAFFLFKVKCRPIQEYVQAPEGSFLALWQDGTRHGRTNPVSALWQYGGEEP